MHGTELHPNHNFDKMTKEELVALLRVKTNQLRYANRRLRQANKLLKREQNSSFIDPEDEELMSIMSSAAEYVKSNKDSCRNAIVMALIQSAVKQDGKKSTKESISDTLPYAVCNGWYCR
jgi:hypothetical protein